MSLKAGRKREEGRIGELDEFVASFEMNTRNRREQPLNGESFNAPFRN